MIPQYVEASRTLAQVLVTNHQDAIDDRWTELFRRLVSRVPTDKERSIMQSLYREQLEFFSAAPNRADEFLQIGQRGVNQSLPHNDLAATTVVVQTIIAYDESMMLR